MKQSRNSKAKTGKVGRPPKADSEKVVKLGEAIPPEVAAIARKLSERLSESQGRRVGIGEIVARGILLVDAAHDGLGSRKEEA